MRTQLIRTSFPTAIIVVFAVSAAAKSPEEIFRLAAPSVVVIEVLNTGGKVEAFGSGVAVATGEVITNCHVAQPDKSLRVKHGHSRYAARLRHADRDRDLCQLTVSGLTALPARLGDAENLRTGARVVAIGAPRGLELTISEGLISALRETGDGAKLIQTTAPISRGSSGGGLFDEAGRLIGITTFYIAEGQNLNFALPVGWIRELPKRATLLPRDRTPSFDWLALASALESDPPRLLAHAQRWTQAEPRNARAWALLGLTYAKLGAYDDAVEAYFRSVEINTGNAHVWFFLGNSYSKLGDTSEAAKAYEVAVQMNPKHAGAWNNLGVLRGEAGQRTEAIVAFRHAVGSDPKHVDAWFNLGSHYALIDRYDEAMHALYEGLRLEPKNPTGWYKLGLVHAKQGNRRAVLEAYETLRHLDRSMADDLFDRALKP